MTERQLSATKRALLERWKRGHLSASKISPGIPRRPHSERAPVAFAQRRLWLVEQLQPGAGAYVEPSFLYLSGPLDLSALEMALDAMVARHEALRTRFEVEDGEPVQIVANSGDVPSLSLPVVDLQGCRQAEEAGRGLAVAALRQPFDLYRGPLLRAVVCKLRKEAHFLLIAVHHIVLDGWSSRVLMHEMTTVYEALRTGGSPLLTPKVVQFPDFAAWQRETLVGQRLEGHLNYWRERLRDLPESFDLPFDRPRPARPTAVGFAVPFQLGEELTATLGAWSRPGRGTLFMTLLAVFQALLARYSGHRDLCVGSPTAGRNHPDLERTVGCFINLLVLRVQLKKDITWQGLLAEVRRVVLEAQEHEELPFEVLVDAVASREGHRVAPLFQYLFAFQNTPSPQIRLGELRLERQELDKGRVKYDLGLQLEERDGRVRGWLEYSSELLDRTTVSRFLGHLEGLLERAAAEPQKRVWETSLLEAAEHHQLLVEWNDTLDEGPSGPFLHQRFSARARAQPAATAVEFEGSSLSYGELESWTNRVARALQDRGVRRETVVGVALERSVELVVALLAVLKSGGAYVPVDPSYPPDRIAFLLEDAEVPVLLTTVSVAAELPGSGAERVFLDGGEAAFAGFSGATLEVPSLGSGLAYTIYTSGSTGKPKGAMNSHDAILNRLLWMQEYFQLTAEDRVLQKTPFSFDVSVWEFFWPLMIGATLVVARPEGHRDGAYLRHLIQRDAVTTVHFVPSMLAAFLEEPALEELTSLRRVICSGEALPSALARRCLERLPAPLFNLYGPTEAAVDVTAWRCKPGSEDRPSEPIGRPITGTGIGMVDDNLRSVPLGVPGELLIGGIGLARGYRGRPGLTAECFVPNPLTGPMGARRGARAYRSGDRARTRTDGAIEFLGRLDYQVKVRGLRIELGEIEAAMVCHAGVSEAVVAAVPAAGGMRLLGYVVPSQGSEHGFPTPAELQRQLRKFLAQRLPEAMIPSIISSLEALPRLANGKIDRRALPLLPQGPAAEERYVAPRGPLEEALAELGSQVLGIERMGAFDNFFALGGHSLTATRLLARVSSSTGVEVPLPIFLEQPTVASLAVAVENGSSLSAPPPVAVRPRAERFPLSFPQRRLWILDQLNPGSVAYNVPAKVQLRGRLLPGALADALTAVVQRHEALRTTFRLVGGEPEQVVLPRFPVPLSVIDFSSIAEAEKAEARVASALANRPFDLEKGPLLRALLLRSSSQEHTFVLCLHHIVTDAWSMAVLVEELGQHYQAIHSGNSADLAPLPVQYPDFARWQVDVLQGERREALLSYWKERLTPLPSALELPFDRPRPAIRQEAGGTVRFTIGEDLRLALGELARKERATLFVILLAAFQALLARYSGQRDFAVGTVVANRHRGELEGLIGFFVNSLVMRAELTGDPAFTQLLERTRRSAFEAYAHQDLPFETLVDELAPRRELSQTPLFQVVFALQNTPTEEVRLPGITLERQAFDNDTAKFDLSLQIEERQDRLHGWAVFSTDLFDPTTIERLIRHFQTLTESAVAAPGRRLSELSVLSGAESHQLMLEWSGHGCDAIYGETIAAVFAASASAQPSAPALVDGATTITYGELDRRSNQLARRLHALGVREDHRIPVVLESSVEAITAMVAAAKLGAAYVPLNPDYPVERLDLTLEDIESDGNPQGDPNGGQAPVLVTVETYRDRVRGWSGEVLCLDREASVLAVMDDESLPPRGGPSHLFYLVFTSGSTGRAKAVAVPQSGVLRLVQDPGYVRFTADDVFLQMAPLTFDASIVEIWGALLNGGCLVLLPPGERSLDQLQSAVESEGVTVLLLIAGVFHLIVDQRPEMLRGVRQLLAGGDVLSAAHVHRCRELFPHNRFLNAYGPTENATITTSHAVGGAEGVVGPIPIGRPIPGTEVRVLDGALGRLPVGIVGDLYTSGAGLARGYVGRPALTAERFVPDPYSDRPGDRLYRIGDLVRWRQDGTLDFMAVLTGS